ncbi:MAG: hypothetical protein Q9203_002555 [Teloschistes exilis]
MTSVDFAAAERRVAERRKARASALQLRDQAHRSEQALRATGHLPFPLNTWSRKSIEAWDNIKGRTGTRPAFRVGQVDAELLDEELLELLKGQTGEALKYFGSHLRDEWSSEILLGLRIAMYKLSIWDHNASYGAALQNLCYSDARHLGPHPKPPTQWQKAWYGIFSIGGRYAWEKWNVWLVDQEGNYDANPTSTSENEVLAVSGLSSGVVGSAQTDITNPYEMMPCGCIYCFVCAVSRLEAADGEGWTCLRCGEVVKECKPWVGDVEDKSEPRDNRKMVSFSNEEEQNAHGRE